MQVPSVKKNNLTILKTVEKEMAGMNMMEVTEIDMGKSIRLVGISQMQG
jgi:hypothetical protein